MGIRDLFTAPERYASLSGERLGADDMSIFDYVMILLSVVISLGLAKLLENHAHLIKHGKRVTWSAVYLGWLVIMVLAEIDTWASLWQVHTNARWTALDIGLSLLAAALLFYASILSTPETMGDEPIDLWDFHLTNRHRYLTRNLTHGPAAAEDAVWLASFHRVLKAYHVNQRPKVSM